MEREIIVKINYKKFFRKNIKIIEYVIVMA